MIYYMVGDATHPEAGGQKLIAHICNDVGGWGRGFVLALSRRWKAPEMKYRALGPKECRLGVLQFVMVDTDITVANMVAQRGLGDGRQCLVDFYALGNCLRSVRDYAKTIEASVHMPRIGCGLGGARWEQIEPIVAATFPETSVYVYDLPRR